MMNNYISSFNLNIPQAKAMLVNANDTTLLWSRGTGKTTVDAAWVLHKVDALPRSCGALMGRSFADLKSKILKPLFTGFKMMGHEQDVHFVFGRKPPAHWAKPLIPIIDFTYVISFPNGTVIQLVSFHEEGSANSNSFQWAFGPEAKFFDPEQLANEFMPSMRGLVPEFGDSPWYCALLLETDKYDSKGRINWLLDKRKLHDEETTNAVLYWQLKYNELHARLPLVAESTADKYRRKMKAITQVLNKLRRNLIYVSEANSLDNIQNLGHDWIETQKKRLVKYIFDIAIMNLDPTRAEDGFYPERADRHLYEQDNDDDVTKPLCITLDYQASISPLCVAQMNDLVIPGVPSLNFLNAFYVKWPLGIKHVIQKFAEYYRDRPCKEVVYFYDHTAKGQRNMHKTYWEEVVEYFEQEGWTITAVYMGDAPDHGDKYKEINRLLREDEYTDPIRMHAKRCLDMIISIDLTETKNNAGTEKDKSSERSTLIPAEKATHFSDTFDMMVWALMVLKLYSYAIGASGGEVGVRRR